MVNNEYQMAKLSVSCSIDQIGNVKWDLLPQKVIITFCYFWFQIFVSTRPGKLVCRRNAKGYYTQTEKSMEKLCTWTTAYNHTGKTGDRLSPAFDVRHIDPDDRPSMLAWTEMETICLFFFFLLLLLHNIG